VALALDLLLAAARTADACKGDGAPASFLGAALKRMATTRLLFEGASAMDRFVRAMVGFVECSVRTASSCLAAGVQRCRRWWRALVDGLMRALLGLSGGPVRTVSECRAAVETTSTPTRRRRRRRSKKKTKKTTRLRRRARRVVELVRALEDLGALRAEVDEVTSLIAGRHVVEDLRAALDALRAKARGVRADELPPAWRQRVRARRREVLGGVAAIAALESGDSREELADAEVDARPAHCLVLADVEVVAQPGDGSCAFHALGAGLAQLGQERPTALALRTKLLVDRPTLRGGGNGDGPARRPRRANMTLYEALVGGLGLARSPGALRGAILDALDVPGSAAFAAVQRRYRSGGGLVEARAAARLVDVDIEVQDDDTGKTHQFGGGGRLLRLRRRGYGVDAVFELARSSPTKQQAEPAPPSAARDIVGGARKRKRNHQAEVATRANQDDDSPMSSAAEVPVDAPAAAPRPAASAKDAPDDWLLESIVCASVPEITRVDIEVDRTPESRLLHKASPPPDALPGLPNPRAVICFMNATVQCLAVLPGVLQAIVCAWDFVSGLSES